MLKKKVKWRWNLITKPPRVLSRLSGVEEDTAGPADGPQRDSKSVGIVDLAAKHTLLMKRLRPWHWAIVWQSSIRCCHGNTPWYLFFFRYYSKRNRNKTLNISAVPEPSSAGQNVHTRSEEKSALRHEIHRKQDGGKWAGVVKRLGCTRASKYNLKKHVFVCVSFLGSPWLQLQKSASHFQHWFFKD